MCDFMPVNDKDLDMEALWRGEYDENLGAFPMKDIEAWTRISDFVDEERLSKLTDSGGKAPKSEPVKDEEPEKEPEEGESESEKDEESAPPYTNNYMSTIINYTHIPWGISTSG